MRCLGAAALLLAGCSAAGASRGPGPAPLPEPRDRSSWAVTLENDLFTGSDDSYTNGFSVAWTSRRAAAMESGALAGRWIDALGFLPLPRGAGHDRHATVAVGQELFTPEDIDAVVRDPDDQPYAGILFADLGVLSRSDVSAHAWRLRLGLVGPSALGEQAQREFHELTGGDQPVGWDAQLPDEPILNLDYGYSREVLAHRGGDGFGWRLSPVGGAGLGTYFTGASGGLRGECGWNLPRSASFPSLRRGVNTLSPVDAGTRGPWSVSLFASAGGFLVGRFLPLDGTVFRDSPSVDSEPLVGYLSAGLMVRKRRFSIGFQTSLFTDTFDGQDNPTDFGTLTIAWSP